MSNVMSYSSLNAKVHAMSSSLLKKEDYEALSQMRKTADIQRFLVEHGGYSEAFRSMEEKTVNRHSMEQVMQGTLTESLVKMYHFVQKDTDKEFLDFYFKKYEILILKSAMQVIYDATQTKQEIPILDEFIDSRFSVDFSKTNTIRSMKDFMRLLEGTEYFAVLDRAVEEEATLFELEMRLDVFYHMNLWKKALKLYPKDEGIKAIFGTQIDLYNLFSLYRLKKYFKLDSALLYSKVIPVHYRLKKEALNEMIEAKTFQGFFSVAAGTFYADAIAQTEDTETKEIEYSIMEETYRKYRKRNEFSILSLLEFMFKKESEIKNVTTLIEGVRYSRKPEEILRLLYVPGKKDGAKK